MEALRKKESQDETQFINKVDGSLNFIPPRMLTYFFCRLFLNFTQFMTKLRVLMLSFPYFTDNSNMCYGVHFVGSSPAYKTSSTIFFYSLMYISIWWICHQRHLVNINQGLCICTVTVKLVMIQFCTSSFVHYLFQSS